VKPSVSTPAGRETEVRDRIFASALRHFSQKGYAATSLREVSEDAQTTKPMIYYYFGSKEGLYGSIIRQILEEMAETIRAHFPGDADPAEQAIVYCQRYLDHFLAQEDIIALVLREVFGLGGASMDTFSDALGRDVRRPLDDLLERGMATGFFRCDVPHVCASAITGILNMFILAHVFGGAPIDREEAIRQVRYYINGLLAEKPSSAL